MSADYDLETALGRFSAEAHKELGQWGTPQALVDALVSERCKGFIAGWKARSGPPVPQASVDREETE